MQKKDISGRKASETLPATVEKSPVERAAELVERLPDLNSLGAAVRGVGKAVTAPVDTGGEVILRGLQRMRTRGLVEGLKETWRGLKDAGKIREDYDSTTQCADGLMELLQALELDLADRERLDLMKKILLVAATESRSTRDDPRPLEYVRICRSLRAGEILVLLATGRMQQQKTNAVDWLSEAAAKTGLVTPELVEVHERELMRKLLLTGRRHGDESGVVLRNGSRLTYLGRELYDYVAAYEGLEVASRGREKS